MAELDHYSVLGVLPTADDVVIRAAYRALAQRYHPDKWRGDPKEATEKMAEINSAYAVLSDPSKRRAFDQTRSAHQNAEPFFREDSEDREPTYDPLVGDWQIAVNFYPDLADLEKGLEKLSWRVAFAYRVEMLEKRQFEHRSEIAQRIEQDYLLRHFGTNPDVLSFARSLIEAGNKRAALALNQAIRVLGVSTSADVVIQRIASQYCSDDFETPIKRRLREQTKGSFLGAVKELLT
jgi:curved DNA-binding protein CbpA